MQITRGQWSDYCNDETSAPPKAVTAAPAPSTVGAAQTGQLYSLK